MIPTAQEWKARAIELGKERDDGRTTAFEVYCNCDGVTLMTNTSTGVECPKCGDSVEDITIIKAHGLEELGLRFRRVERIKV